QYYYIMVNVCDSSYVTHLFQSNSQPTPSTNSFPYTTLFRSHPRRPGTGIRGAPGGAAAEHRARTVRIRPRTRTGRDAHGLPSHQDRKSTRLNSSHVSISYAVFCL